MKKHGFHLSLFFLLGVSASTLAMASSVTVKAVAIDPAVGSLDTGSLIDRLRYETQSIVPQLDASGKETGLSIVSPALAGMLQFMPLDVQLDWERNIRREAKSPVMTELIRRGVAALPQLLQHLDDPRPTLLVKRGPDIGIVAFGDHYDARYQDPARRPTGVDQTGPYGEHGMSNRDAYVYTVGDLCYRAALNIVNRREVGGRAMNASFISSPARYPALAAAMRADWAGLTAQEHEAGLRAESLELNPDGSRGLRSSGAVQRLLFYYTETGRQVAETLLRRALDDPAAKSDSPRWLADSYLLMDDLAAFEWEGLDDMVFVLFEKAVRLPDLNGELTMICARRLAGRGRDGKLREGLEALIAGNEATKTDRRVRLEANESYRDFLRKLAAR